MNALLQIGLSNAAVCGLMTIVLLPLARRLRKPALTHALSVMILVKLVTPPLFSVPVLRNSAADSIPSPQITVPSATPFHEASTSLPVLADANDDDAEAPAVDAAIARATRLTQVNSVPPTSPAPPPMGESGIWKTESYRWRSWLLTFWIASAVLLGAVTLGRLIRFGFAVRRATVPGRDIAAEVKLLANRLGIRRAPRVRFIAGSAPPMLLALWRRPELVIPARLWDRLEDGQRQTLLLHELAHLRRGDHRVRYVELLATCVYWWHPGMWFARAALHEAEEQCCDAWVVWAMPELSHTYMATILDAVDFLSLRASPRLQATSVLASGMGQFHNLQRRLTMVRERTVQRRLSGRGLAAVALLAAIALPLGAKMARGDDQPAQRDPAGVPAADVTSPAPGTVASADPRDPTAAPLTASTDLAQPDRDRTGSEQAREMARLEAQVEAAQRNVERFRRQLDAVKRRSESQRPEDPTADRLAPAIAQPRGQNQMSVSTRANYRLASLGHILFTYQSAGSGGRVLAYDRSTRQLMWSLKVPLNADSVIQCFDNETLLIRSADGYTRLVNAEDGQVTRAWAPGAEAPPAALQQGVNPFGQSNALPESVQTSVPHTARFPLSDGQDQEKRLERIEENLRVLTEAVNRLTREQNERRSSSAAPGRAGI